MLCCACFIALTCAASATHSSQEIFIRHTSPDPLTQQAIDACALEVGPRWPSGHAAGAPVVMTYATKISDPFMLGVSAALHNMPLAVVGFNMPGWNWWDGVVLQKVSAPRRAVQLVQALLGDVPVALVDSGDVLVTNGLTMAQRHALEQFRRHVLLGAECNSWPVCYRDAYARDTEHQHCLGKHGACFPNGGVSLARSSTMLDFLSAFRTVGKSTLQMSNLAERGNDQSALHYLYLNRSRFPTLQVHVDSSSRFSLQLWTCKGNQGGYVYRQRGGPFELCHHRKHEPLNEVRVSGDGRTLEFNETRNGTRIGKPQHPVFVHSNGYHFKLKDPIFAPLLSLYEDPTRLAELLERPVLLVEWQHERRTVPCTVASLGWLINATRHPKGAPRFLGRTMG